MAKFAFSLTIHFQVEAQTVQEAFKQFVLWRKFLASSLSGRLEKAGVYRYSVPPIHEFTEIDDKWLENQKLRRKLRKEWEYEVREEPVMPGSKLMLTHRIAVGPMTQKE